MILRDAGRQLYYFRMRRPLPQPFRRIITKEQTFVQRDSGLLFLTIRAECLRLLLLNASLRNTAAIPLTLVSPEVSVSFSTRSPIPNPTETGSCGEPHHAQTLPRISSSAVFAACMASYYIGVASAGLFYSTADHLMRYSICKKYDQIRTSDLFAQIC